MFTNSGATRNLKLNIGINYIAVVQLIRNKNSENTYRKIINLAEYSYRKNGHFADNSYRIGFISEYAASKKTVYLDKNS